MTATKTATKTAKTATTKKDQKRKAAKKDSKKMQKKEAEKLAKKLAKKEAILAAKNKTVAEIIAEKNAKKENKKIIKKAFRNAATTDIDSVRSDPDPLTRDLVSKIDEIIVKCEKKPKNMLKAVLGLLNIKQIQNSTDTAKYKVKDSYVPSTSYNNQALLSEADMLAYKFLSDNEIVMCTVLNETRKITSAKDIITYVNRTFFQFNMHNCKADLIKTNSYSGEDNCTYYMNSNKSMHLNVHQPTTEAVKAVQGIQGVDFQSVEIASDLAVDSSSRRFCASATKALTYFLLKYAIFDPNMFSLKLRSPNAKCSALSYSINNYTIQAFKINEEYTVYSVCVDAKNRVLFRIYCGSKSRPEDFNKIRVEVVLLKDKAADLGIDINTDMSSLPVSALDFFRFYNPADAQFKHLLVDTVMEKHLCPSLSKQCQDPHMYRQVRRLILKEFNTVDTDQPVIYQFRDLFGILGNKFEGFSEKDFLSIITSTSVFSANKEKKKMKRVRKIAAKAGKNELVFQQKLQEGEKLGEKLSYKVYKNKYKMKVRDRDALIENLRMDTSYLKEISITQQRGAAYKNRFESQFKHIQKAEDQEKCIVMYRGVYGDEENTFIPCYIKYFTNDDTIVTKIKAFQESVNTVDLEKLRQIDYQKDKNTGRCFAMGKYGRVRCLSREIKELSEQVNIESLCSYTSWQLYNYCLRDEKNKAALERLLFLWHRLRNTVFGIPCNGIQMRDSKDSNSDSNSNQMKGEERVYGSTYGSTYGSVYDNKFCGEKLQYA